MSDSQLQRGLFYFAKRNETKYMGEGGKMFINLNTAEDNIDNVFGSNS